MASPSLEKRVAALEEELASLRRKSESASGSKRWQENIAGTLAHDPIYEEEMRSGREYRESLRPGKRSG
jgi:hypothetical protein